MTEQQDGLPEFQESLFRPYITVDDDGQIDVDFSDCFIGTMHLTSLQERGDNMKHADLLDKVLGEGTVAEKLRNLASYIEGWASPERRS